MQLSYTVRLGRELSASMDGPWLDKIVGHIAKWKWEGPEGCVPMDEFSSLLEKGSWDRICWRAQQTEYESGAWLMRYQLRERKGTLSRSRERAFQVPRHTLSGEIYNHAETLEVARQVLRHVKRCWNLWDESDKPRFDV